MKRVWIVGAGKRVRALSKLAPSELGHGDLVYVAVGKDAVPEVLRGLARFDRSKLELLIDTPVLRFKHLRHVALLDGWARASVAEDTAYLPWYAPAREAAGPADRVTFDRSAYAYHGCAQAKSLLAAGRVERARRRARDGGVFERELLLEGGARAMILEPRDYSMGSFFLHGSRRTVTDSTQGSYKDEGDPPEWQLVRIQVLEERGLCAAFRAGEVESRLDPREAELTRGDAPGASVTARMESMKRIGFRRLLVDVAAGKGAYPIGQGLDDMAVDWFLERFGRWRAGGAFDVRNAGPRALWSVLGRLR